MHENCLLLFEKYVNRLFKPDMEVLEIGPNRLPSDFCQMVSVPVQWDTLDLNEHKRLTYSGVSEYQYPIPDDRYDIVLSANVMEHVKKIWLWIDEQQRVCKPGGFVVIIAPVSWPFHEAPVDCWRIYPDGMKALLEDTSLKIIHCGFESLENPGLKRPVPGRSYASFGPKWRFYYRVAGALGLPVQRSYDMITIAQKRIDHDAEPEIK